MIQLNDISITAGDFQLSKINFTIPTGKYGVLMGRTGSGKTTVLEAIAGLSTVTAGQIMLGDRDVTHLKPAQRNLGYVPQDGALFDTMSVYDHLGFALTIRKVSKTEIKQRVHELAELLDIADLLDREPYTLSGGEAQRVALGRALAHRPSVLCLDEPLSALDEELHEEICRLIERVHQETGVTILHVTHSPSEAKRLAGCHFRMIDGKVKREED